MESAWKMGKKWLFLRKFGGMLICSKKMVFEVLFFATTKKMAKIADFLG
jgi:hypothetical protein